MGFSPNVYPTVPLILVLLCVLYVRLLARWRTRSLGRPFPPGPSSVPLFGNLFNTPGDKAWLAFRDLAAQYSDIIHFRTLGKSTIVLNSADAINEFFEKHASSTSDRPQTPAIEMLDQLTNFSLMPYGQQWRRYRRYSWQHFTSHAIEQYKPITRAAAHQFLGRLIEQPSQVRDHIRLFLATVLKVVYGIPLTEDHGQYVATFHLSAEGISQELAPGKYIFDILPFLKNVPKWVPGFAWQGDFERWRAAVQDMKDVPYARAKEAMSYRLQRPMVKTPTASSPKRWRRPAMLTSLTRMSIEHEEMAKGIGLVSYEAGADTSFSALQAFFLAMSQHPGVQKKAQAEVDAVVGPGRMPDFSDLESLVYVNAVIKETLRWHTVFPLGLAHGTIVDDELRGYFIPAGTVLLPNIWACMHDLTVYEDLEAFRPERFIRDGKLDSSVQDPVSFIFGFRRRVCPGRHFALASLFINVASILHGFNIMPSLDEDDHPIAIRHSQSIGLISYPEDCRCIIKPRSAEAAALIIANAKAVV